MRKWKLETKNGVFILSVKRRKRLRANSIRDVLFNPKLFLLYLVPEKDYNEVKISSSKNMVSIKGGAKLTTAEFLANDNSVVLSGKDIISVGVF